VYVRKAGAARFVFSISVCAFIVRELRVRGSVVCQLGAFARQLAAEGADRGSCPVEQFDKSMLARATTGPYGHAYPDSELLQEEPCRTEGCQRPFLVTAIP
jgi:hypothetical protein